MKQAGFTLIDLTIGVLLAVGTALTVGALSGGMVQGTARTMSLNASTQSATSALEHILKVGRCASVCEKKMMPSDFSSSCLNAYPSLPSEFETLECTVDYQKAANIIDATNTRFRLKSNSDCTTTLLLERRSGASASEAWGVGSPYPNIASFKICDSNDLSSNVCNFGTTQIVANSPRFFRFQLIAASTAYSRAQEVRDPANAWRLAGIKLESSFFMRNSGFASGVVLQCDPSEKMVVNNE